MIAMVKRLWARHFVGQPADSDYLHPAFLSAIGRRPVRTIVELGSLNGDDTCRLRDTFGAFVHTFECNPFVLPALRARLAAEPRVRLVERAAWDADEWIPFYPVVSATASGKPLDNPGASSCFPAKPGYHQTYVQEMVTVEAMRLDTYCSEQGIDEIDLLCMDVQGAALRVLRGLGHWIEKTSMIIAEIEHLEMYVGEALYPEIDRFLVSAGFRRSATVERDAWFRDYLYLRRR